MKLVAPILTIVWIFGCTPCDGGRVKVEVLRSSIKGRQEIVYVLLDPRKLREAGISTEQPRQLVASYFQQVEDLIADAVLVWAGTESKPRNPPSDLGDLRWVPRVFPKGIPIELVVIEKDGTQKAEQMMLRIEISGALG
jgi:hypothetical protein